MSTRPLLRCCFAVLFLIPGLIVSAQAQQESTSRFFVKVIAGYSFLGPGSQSGVNRTNRTGSSTISSDFEQSKKKFGLGPKFGIGVGLIINESINLGVDVVYLKGNPVVLTNNIVNQRDTIGVQSFQTTNTNIDTKYEYSLLNIVPNITFKAISKPNYYIYNRIGLIVSLPLGLNYTYKGTSSTRIQYLSNTNVVTSDYTYGYSYDYDGDYSQTPAFGYQAALGVQFRISSNLRFFGELEASSLVLIPKELEYTSYKYTSSTTRTVPTPATTTTFTDSKLRHVYYQKSGQQRTVTNANSIDVYSSQTRIPTNSVAMHIGLAIRL